MDCPGEKLAIKFWETLSEKGIGSLLKPWQIVREGRARTEVRRQELLMLAQTKLDIADLRAGRKILNSDGTLALAGPSSTCGNGADFRIEPVLDLESTSNAAKRAALLNNARSEVNVSKAIIFAEEQILGDIQEPPSREIDEDWLFAWRENASKVSNEDLQRLWGSVLAGEILSPGKYSIRTLEFLKTLSKSEAELICNLARYVIAGFVFRNQKTYLESKGLNLGFFLRMQEFGMISGVEVDLRMEFRTTAENKFFCVFESHSKGLLVEHNDPSRTLKMKIYPLTEVGNQILGLGFFEPDIEYIKLVGSEIAKQGFKVHLTDWKYISENQKQYFNEVLIDPTQQATKI